MSRGREVIVVIGASAGVGRAVAVEFARRGAAVALLARGVVGLDAAREEVVQAGGVGLVIPCDVADAKQVERAADRIESTLGPIDIWVNSAMATVFCPVQALTADDVRRATEVTYLGTVHGTLAALRHMQPRGRGTIVQVGSALAYRGIPLQAPYCAAKFAIRGFTDALQTELRHDRSPIKVTMVQLAAFNTPQFDWARNCTGHAARPVPPVFQPEVAARAIAHAALHPRRETWVGSPAIKAILGTRLLPGRWIDRYLAQRGYASQLDPALRLPSPGNLYTPWHTDAGVHGRFDAQAYPRSRAAWFSRWRGTASAAAALVGAFAVTRRGSARARRLP